MANYIFGIILILAVVFVCRYCINRFADNKTEEQLERDKETADQLTTSIDEQSAGI